MMKAPAVTPGVAQSQLRPVTPAAPTRRPVRGSRPRAAAAAAVATAAAPHIALSICAAGIAVTIDAMGTRYLGTPPLGIPLVAAIVAAAWFGTWRSGLATAMFCLLLLRLPQLHPAWQGPTGGQAATASFVALAMMVVLLCHFATSARRESAAALGLIRQADARNSECVALLAHELRNPLAAVCSGLELVRLCPDPDTLRTTAGRMERQLSHVTRLVEDLLESARLDRGTARLQLRSRSVDSLVTDAVSLATAFTAPARQHVIAALDADAGSIDVDPDKIMQVLGNLLHNASKFSPPGSTITVRVMASGEEVLIAVRDAGTGIPPDQLDRIFCRYAQVEPGAHKGLGLGLSLVRQWMDLHGGSVVARSAGLGAGSEFILTFRRPVLATHPESDVAPVGQIAPLRVRDAVAAEAAWLRRTLPLRPFIRTRRPTRAAGQARSERAGA
jgi:signal transduction histidine kinase